MNTQSSSTKSFTPVESFFHSNLGRGYVWDNLIIEKRISVSWIYKLYKGSLLEDIWLILSSPVK
ncbi:MAG: hypothetical protein Q8P26_04005 [Candidatus Levybacteria bacterium]|nr:hypothetical protein [Candidatus Levybacteria bacterium]